MNQKLIDAIYEEDEAKVAKFLANGVDPNEPCDGVSPLVEACGKSSVGIVAILLKAGAEVNRLDETLKHSPLTAACEAGNIETVKLLISQGADIDYLRRNVSSPLSVASEGREKSRIALVKCLLDAGADPRAVFFSQKGTKVANVLMDACQFSSAVVVELLIKAGAPVNQVLDRGTPLIAAIEEGRADIVEVLLSHGADPSLATPEDSGFTDIAGKNALALATHLKKKKIVEILQSFLDGRAKAAKPAKPRRAD